MDGRVTDFLFFTYSIFFQFFYIDRVEGGGCRKILFPPLIGTTNLAMQNNSNRKGPKNCISQNLHSTKDKRTARDCEDRQTHNLTKEKNPHSRLSDSQLGEDHPRNKSISHQEQEIQAPYQANQLPPSPASFGFENQPENMPRKTTEQKTQSRAHP